MRVSGDVEGVPEALVCVVGRVSIGKPESRTAEGSDVSVRSRGVRKRRKQFTLTLNTKVLPAAVLETTFPNYQDEICFYLDCGQHELW